MPHIWNRSLLNRKYNIRLNPNKCTFKVEGEKFLEFILKHRGRCATTLFFSNSICRRSQWRSIVDDDKSFATRIYTRS